MSAPSRILVIRLSAIGDVIMASGLIPALAETFPDARQCWLTDAAQADLVRQNPRLDRVFVVPRSRWRGLRRERRYRQWLAEMMELVRQLRAENFDLVLDLQGLLRSGLWAWLTGGRRIGLGSREGSQWLMTEVVDRKIKDTAIISAEYRWLAEYLGARPGSFVLDIPIAAADRAAATALLRAEGVRGGYAVLCPFTTRSQKHWFDERWAELSNRLAAAGLQPVLLGGPGDRERAASLRDLARGPLVDLAGRTRLGQCAAILAGAQLAIGVDTGLTHLSIAEGTPTLALFGSTRPYLDPGDGRSRVLYEPLNCSPCRRHPTCDGRFDCMRLHSVDSVFKAALMLLQGV